MLQLLWSSFYKIFFALISIAIILCVILIVLAYLPTTILTILPILPILSLSLILILVIIFLFLGWILLCNLIYYDFEIIRTRLWKDRKF